MRKGSTLFLKGVLILLGFGILALCIFAFPSMGRGLAAEFPEVAYLRYSVLIGYAAAVPIMIAFYQAFKLLTYIDNNIAFSEFSVKALKAIKYCTIAVCVLFMGTMPFIYGIAEVDDAPGLIIFGLIFACSPLVITVFAAVLQKLVQNAIEIKLENDLTV